MNQKTLQDRPLKIIADENLALTDYFFADLADIEYRAGRGIQASDVHNANALLVRSVTKVTPALLQGSAVEFVGSATIGTDHIDLTGLAAANIDVSHAPGCNAQAVAEYVVTAILTLQPEKIHAGRDFCLGLIGLGNVGSRLAMLAQRLGWRVIGTDPNVQLPDIENLSFAQVLAQSDAISIHVPLTQTGIHATYHLFNADTFAQMKPACLLINSARGEVVSEQALLDDIAKTRRPVVLDVFEQEPVISQNLLDHLALATPHIAGYSLEGKARGTQMIYQAFCQHFNINASKQFESQLADMPELFSSDQPLQSQLLSLLPQLYDIRADDQALRAGLNADGVVDAAHFDYLRKTYPLRREWAAYGDQSL
ncbi:4-phosphoerythronate dehydrogenase [Alkanindiges illinoisensis]|uniref:4-phosphoerythronate dehydrogenase n=1 Tax=Alkanindiges illinoisensis TaxID=197183 RepID=UPI00047D1470|nr:4-phosphoerythronate dehydrogenase [Alkanindiges illinoisensis]